jgi:hypothetical protein
MFSDVSPPSTPHKCSRLPSGDGFTFIRICYNHLITHFPVNRRDVEIKWARIARNCGVTVNDCCAELQWILRPFFNITTQQAQVQNSQLAEFELFMLCPESMLRELYMQINHFQTEVLSVNAVQNVMVSLYLLLNLKQIKYTNWPIIIDITTSHNKQGIFNLKRWWICSGFIRVLRWVKEDSCHLALSVDYLRLSNYENVELDSKGFRRCFITLGITRILVLVYRPVFHSKQLFGDWSLPVPPLPST